MAKKVIMVIDNNKENLEELRGILRKNGYFVMAFSDSQKALKKINKLKPDILLLNLFLKRLSGFELANIIKSSLEIIDVPIIAMTDFYAKEALEIFIRFFGIEKCLIKPFKPEELIREIGNVSTAVV